MTADLATNPRRSPENRARGRGPVHRRGEGASLPGVVDRGRARARARGTPPILSGAMAGLWQRLFGGGASGLSAEAAREPEPASADPSSRSPMTAKALARRLLVEHDGRPDSDALWRACEVEGVDIRAVDRELDLLEEAANVRRASVDPSRLRILDLTGLEAMRMRVVGVSYSVTQAERERFGGTEYLLIREPENTSDPQAVAVYGKGRRVGYLSTARAQRISALLASLDADAFQVTGAATNERSSVLWVDVPRLPVLRTFVTGRGT